jgi:hypothetical protein
MAQLPRIPQQRSQTALCNELPSGPRRATCCGYQGAEAVKLRRNRVAIGFLLVVIAIMSGLGTGPVEVSKIGSVNFSDLHCALKDCRHKMPGIYYGPPISDQEK